MEKEKRILLYLVSGFLGSGKTTLMLKLLEELEGKKVGVVVNEFGKLGIDGKIINHSGIDMIELSNGQIFCSCLEGDFIRSLVELARFDLEYVIVEASGLALPQRLETTIKEIKRFSNDAYDFRGNICVIDAGRFFDLVDLVNAFEEQIVFSDIILINKIDLVDEELIKNIETEIRKRNSRARIMYTEYCDSVKDILNELENTKSTGRVSINIKNKERFLVDDCINPSIKRSSKYLLVPENKVEEKTLLEFLKEIAPFTYRIKGFVRGNEGLLYIDSTGSKNISVKAADQNIEESRHGINIISSEDIEEKIVSKWEQVNPGPYIFK